LEGFSGELEDIIANELSFVIQTVTVKPGDAGFGSENCGTWSTTLSAPSSGSSEPFGQGTWVVGSEVAPGSWQNSDSSSVCSWERLSGFGGELSDAIVGNLSTSIQTVTISETDVGFRSERCGTWTKIG
jgi:hypothetical protein